MKKQENASATSEKSQIAANPQMPTMAPPANSFANELGSEGDSGGLSDGIDFFDTDGNHLYKDYSSKNEIRVLEKGVWQAAVEKFSNAEKCENDGLEQFSAGLCKYSTRLDLYKLGDDNGFQLLGGIAKFYLRKLGITGVATGSKESFAAVASTTLDSKGMKMIVISTKNGRILAGNLGSNKYELINVLVHENVHYEKHYEKVNNEDEGESYKGLGVTEKEEGGTLRHLEAYWVQVNHPSWKATDRKWKREQLQVIGKYLTYLSLEDAMVASEWRKIFEEACHFKWKKLTNISDDNEVIWNSK